ncbi:MAG: sigma-70 family RNA polymerase sigma factor, partial [Verrucomicrobia bacterium]|nr:sigma-70 family RNA polymerase sigma factor [Verrucomicrobiota bacterium]
MNDPELLRQYVVHGSHDAFAELVTRHLPLVYTAARRQVRSPDLAHDVAQTVFLDLAAQAPKLRADSSLPAWLFVATRRTAIDLLRREASRVRREQAAMEVAVMKESPSPWRDIEPLLDEAIASLSAPDREALLARFFDRHSLAEISRRLNCSDDAAQKRVSRALDRLRAYFTKRGIVTASAALAADLASLAVQPAPIGLNLSIAATAAQTLPPALAGAAARGLALGGFQKAAVIAVCTAAAGLVVYQAVVLQRRAADVAALSALSRHWADQTGAARAQLGRARLASAAAA